MGAYLHLRGLSELDSMSESSTKAERSYSPDEPNTVMMASTSSGEAATRTTGSKQPNSVKSGKLNDCSKFWAGQIDDVFEDLQVRTGYGNGSQHRIGSNVSERGYGGNHSGERDTNDEIHGNSDTENTRSTQIACVEDKALDKVKPVGIDKNRHATVKSISCTCGAEIIGEGWCSQLAAEHVGGLEEFSAPNVRRISSETPEDEIERLPDHLLIELLVRVPTRDWPAAACVKKRWSQLFKGDGLWQSALLKKWPGVSSAKRWPGPISRGSSKRRYTALCISDALFAKEKVEGVNEVAGHVYLFLKEQLESSTPPLSYGLLHGTIIDQFLACCKTGDEAHSLASHIWIAVLDSLDESENTFHLLMRIAEEWEVFLPYPYSKSQAVQWRLFERLFTDFRDCLSQYNYFDVLTRARNKFELIPQTWLGY